jgi:preprotein translocase subunit SecA
MLQTFLSKVFGSKHDRDVKKVQPIIAQINELEPMIKKLTDEQLRAKTDEFKDRLQKGETLDDLLVEAFAVVREAAIRVLGQRHYDVQLIGGIILHQGKIAEMKTGEGKTLVSTLPSYLNALEGKGVHIVTPNYYLAARDSEWMGGIHRFLGLEVGLILNDMTLEDKKKGYNADITYGVNDAYGFDYMRNNLAVHPDMRVQRELNYAIVDEVDFILIDEARTPLIISGRSDKSADLYYTVNRIVPRLIKDVDYTIDDRNTSKGNVVLTEDGVVHVERLLNVTNLYDPANINFVHHVRQALTAHTIYKRDVDYVIAQGKIVIVDEFTGRLQPGRRWNDGLHQAIEAKEGVRIEEENLSTARITYQNYFRLYKKLAGMTGTAETEAAEFGEIYKLEVATIPPNVSMQRTDYPDVIYKTEKEKFEAIIDEIVSMRNSGRPVLVGTRSIDTSERLSKQLKQRHVLHHVLNAKYHDKEAEIIKDAGTRQAIVIATNMAGRGVDIALGEGVKELGGLHIIGTERHESRRIDNQLRGRAGRQGDPGSSRFYLSLEDELMQRFGSERLASAMEWLGVQEGTPIEHPWISKAIEGAQKKVEEHNFEIRKQVIKYDDVRNTQRTVIYEQRNMVLDGENLKDEIMDMIDEVIEDQLETYAAEKMDRSDWDIPGLIDWVRKTFLIDISRWDPKPDNLSHDELLEKLLKTLKEAYEQREEEVGPDTMRMFERLVMLDRIDDHWIENLYNMDYLEEGIGFVAYGQKDPLVEFKRESHKMFSDMIYSIKEEVVEYMFKVRLTSESEQKRPPQSRAPAQKGSASKDDDVATPQKSGKPGRNELCPCGSGKKYKKCHGRTE